MSNFWTSPTFEPKRAFRFLVEFTPGNGAESLQFLAKSVSRPSYTVSSNPHKFFNHTFHYPGRVEWGTVTLTLVDALEPNASGIFMEYLGTIGYVNPGKSAAQQDIIGKTITKSSATRATGDILIKEMGENDANGAAKIDGTWKLQNAFITEVNFGEHSYDSEDMIDIQLTIQYDWATYS
jgi:hypothetical protein|tara:strand:- start:7 stop:546 length:540 start_codon:yes stop_codon:yes gene_type:complete